jgi:hypothetical protein
MFLPDIVQPVYPLCLPFSSAYLLIVEVLAIAFNSLWLLMTLALLALVIRYGVITREEAYLERKFGDVYRRYRARVRRWLYCLWDKILGRGVPPRRSRYAERHGHKSLDRLKTF